MNAALGGNANPALNTPQGQIATSWAAVVAACYDLFCYYTNQVDPQYAQGRMLDAIARIYFLTRDPPEATVLEIVCSGGTGVIIPVGALIQDTSSNLYSCTNSGTIMASGTVQLPFACTTTGAIPVPGTNSVSIYQSIPAWDSVTCASGTVGTATETDAAFRARRASSVAVNALGVLPAIKAAVAAVPGVLQSYVTDNATSSPVTVGGVTLAANSIYVAAVGGLSLSVATAIWKTKPPGAIYNGNTTVTVYDTSPGYVAPYPSYAVTYEIPNALTIYFAVSILNTTLVPSNATALIQAAVLSAFSGTDGGTATSIGQEIISARYYAGIAALGSWAQIYSLTIGSENTPTVTFTGSLSGGTMTVTAVPSGTLAVGQFITGPNVNDGSYIVALSTGTGGTGTYTLSQSQTLGSGTLYAIAPALTGLAVNINQVPFTSALDIVVTLH
jgi:hypothetical protein